MAEPDVAQTVVCQNQIASDIEHCFFQNDLAAPADPPAVRSRLVDIEPVKARLQLGKLSRKVCLACSEADNKRWDLKAGHIFQAAAVADRREEEEEEEEEVRHLAK